MLTKSYITPEENDHAEMTTLSHLTSPSRISFSTKADWILLNVGGKYFQTTRSTLSKEESFLGRLCQDQSDLKTDVVSFSSALSLENYLFYSKTKDEKGAYLIDRDPDYFNVVLNYLRHGKLILESNLIEEGVLEEAEFYNIQTLIDLVKERLREREKRKLEEETPNRVYRVLQCKEKEITHFMSSLTDGWKFEQLIGHSPSSSSYMYTEGEFLCIVSKQYARDGPEEGNSAVPERVKILRERGSRM